MPVTCTRTCTVRLQTKWDADSKSLLHIELYNLHNQWRACRVHATHAPLPSTYVMR